MRSSWRKLFQDSIRRLSTPIFRSRFEVMKTGRPNLAAFITPEGLVEHQLGDLAAPEEKEQVLLDLIVLYQMQPGLRDEAGLLLLLSMRPALADTYFRLGFLFTSEEDATAEICLAFFDIIDRYPTESAAFVASSIKKGVFRAVHENRQRLEKDRARIETILVYAASVSDLPSIVTSPEEISAQQAWSALSNGGDAYAPDDIELVSLRTSLTESHGLSADDGDLLILKMLCRRGWREIGVRLGVKPETARKRFQRLVEKLKSDPDFTL